MGLLYVILAFSFVILFLVNVVWLGLNLYLWVVNGLQFLLQGMNFAERIYASVFLKWILLADVLWLGFLLAFLIKRKHYKTDPELHYLTHKPITNPKICVSIHAYNEQQIIEKTVKDFLNQKNVKHVLVIDNHSSDRTVELAEKSGAQVITKESNKGYADSWYLGLRESLKTNSDIIVIADADGTFNAYDISKMVPYLDNSDMVVGSRLMQVLNEQGNQLSMFYVWGNTLLAKLFQLKYFSLLHLGIVNLTDVGCSYRCIRREALEKIMNEFTISGTKKLVPNANGSRIALFTTSIAIKNNLKVVEVPITFKKRVGLSKYTNTKLKGLRYGIEYLWFILRS